MMGIGIISRLRPMDLRLHYMLMENLLIAGRKILARGWTERLLERYMMHQQIGIMVQLMNCAFGIAFCLRQKLNPITKNQ